MASGRLGTANLSATTVTDVYTVPAGKVATFNLGITNRNSTQVTVRVALSDTTVTQATDEYIEYDTPIAAAGAQGSVLERTKLVLAAGQILTVYSSAANVSAVCWGFEETA